MAYDASKEKQIEHGLVKKNDRGEYFRVARVVPGDNKMESVDIRLFYTDDGDNVRPTQKGVRVHAEAIVDVAEAIVKAMSPDEREEFIGRIMGEEDMEFSMEDDEE